LVTEYNRHNESIGSSAGKEKNDLMAKISVLYEFHDESIKPFSMLIKFKPGEIDWGKTTLNIPLSTPFIRFMSTDFSDDMLSATVILEDITVTPG
jgi:hypothetical protein